ncbi:MAG: hypothetical protein ACMUJJ_08410 [Roseicyclus sp.]|uniref:hypothetical protein n=1 Tax=Roseicyclus sp. TaxID=1914329 RepID=UPI003A88E2A4
MTGPFSLAFRRHDLPRIAAGNGVGKWPVRPGLHDDLERWPRQGQGEPAPEQVAHPFRLAADLRDICAAGQPIGPRDRLKYGTIGAQLPVDEPRLGVQQRVEIGNVAPLFEPSRRKDRDHGRDQDGNGRHGQLPRRGNLLGRRFCRCGHEPVIPERTRTDGQRNLHESTWAGGKNPPCRPDWAYGPDQGIRYSDGPGMVLPRLRAAWGQHCP